MSSDGPARVSLQFRSADGRDRWRASFVAAGAERQVTLELRDFVPVAPTDRPLDPSASASLLFVADLVNFVPGAPGRLVLHQLTLGRAE